MNTRKRSEICSKSTIKRVESHPSVFIVNFIVDFEYLDVFRGALSCVKTIKSKDEQMLYLTSFKIATDFLDS